MEHFSDKPFDRMAVAKIENILLCERTDLTESQNCELALKVAALVPGVACYVLFCKKTLTLILAGVALQRCAFA